METSDGDAELCVRTGREARAYACEVLRSRRRWRALWRELLETLVESKVVVAHAPTLHAKLARELGSIRVSSILRAGVPARGTTREHAVRVDLLTRWPRRATAARSRSASQSGRVIPISEQQAIEHNRERTRDAFYALCRHRVERSVWDKTRRWRIARAPSWPTRTRRMFTARRSLRRTSVQTARWVN